MDRPSRSTASAKDGLCGARRCARPCWPTECRPDFECQGSDHNTFLDFIHRSAAGAEIYFVANRKDRPELADCTFRVCGRQPELWDPLSGRSQPAVAFKQSTGRTTLPLEFSPHGSLFVVFRQPIAVDAQGSAIRNFPIVRDAVELTGPWSVQFDPQWGGPEQPVVFEKLDDWTARPEDGIKYYSGTATYRKTFDVPPPLAQGTDRVYLNLGTVKSSAAVRLNGRDLGVVWCAPWRVDITDAMQPSHNTLEIDVINLWPNRLIGDQRLPPEQRFTRTNTGQLTHDSPLMPSGLLGPVSIQHALLP